MGAGSASFCCTESEHGLRSVRYGVFQLFTCTLKEKKQNAKSTLLNDATNSMMHQPFEGDFAMESARQVGEDASLKSTSGNFLQPRNRVCSPQSEASVDSFLYVDYYCYCFQCSSPTCTSFMPIANKTLKG